MKRFFKLLLITIVFMLTFSVSSFAEGTEFDGYIVKLKEDAVVLCDDKLEPVYPADGLYKAETLEDANAFLSEAEYIEPDYIFYLDETYDFSVYDNLNIVSASNGTYFQKIGIFGKDVNVAIIDTGIYPHEAIKDKIKGGYNVLNSSFDFTDTNGHGTACAGLIGAAYGGHEVLGVAPKCNLYALKCFDGANTTTSYIIAAFSYALDNFDIDVFNLSSGAVSASTSLKSVIDRAVNSGAIVISSAGNDKGTTIRYPAGFSNVIGVGALNSKGTARASFSNYNTHVFCTAIGASVKVLKPENTGYVSKNGTSFSCPFVAGIIAAMRSLKPNLTTAEVQDILINTCVDMGITGYDTEYGYGKADAKAIVNYMLKDKDFYVSEKDDFFSNTINPVSEYRVWKNPKLEKNPVFFWNEYSSDGKLLKNLPITPDFTEGYAVLSGSTDTKEEIKTFGFYDLENIKPLPFLYTFESGVIEDLGEF